MLIRAFFLFLAGALAALPGYGQVTPHPLAQNRDSIRAHRIAVITFRLDSTNRKSAEYTFDRRGRPVRVIQYVLTGNLVQQYTHRGRRATLRQTYIAGESTQRATYYLRYDGRGRLVELSTFNGSGEEVVTRYQYGTNGLPVSHYSRYQGRTTDSTVYTYRGRLLISTRTRPDRYEEFTYDAQGRLLTHTETVPLITNANYPPGAQPRQQLQHTYSYRPDGLPHAVWPSLGPPGRPRPASASVFHYRFYP